MSSFIRHAVKGVTIVFMPKFTGKGFLEAIQRHKIQVLLLVPSLWVFLAKSPLVKKYDLSSVKVVGSGAAALSTEVEDEINKRFKDHGVSKCGAKHEIFGI